MQENVLDILSARKGHFLLESGHHGDIWLDLESLCLQPRLVRTVSDELAEKLSDLEIDVVCGPLVEGAFVGLIVALKLNVLFTYSERFAKASVNSMFPASYRVPGLLRDGLRGKRVAIVNDVINAGSAVRGTFTDCQDSGASVVAIGALLVLGTAAQEFAASKNIPLRAIATVPNNLWTKSECPLCASGIPLEDIGDFSSALSMV